MNRLSQKRVSLPSSKDEALAVFLHLDAQGKGYLEATDLLEACASLASPEFKDLRNVRWGDASLMVKVAKESNTVKKEGEQGDKRRVDFEDFCTVLGLGVKSKAKPKAKRKRKVQSGAGSSQKRKKTASSSKATKKKASKDATLARGSDGPMSLLSVEDRRSVQALFSSEGELSGKEDL